MCLVLEVLVKGVEVVFLGPPRLVVFRISVPLRAVVGKVVGEGEGGCGEFREPVIGDW